MAMDEVTGWSRSPRSMKIVRCVFADSRDLPWSWPSTSPDMGIHGTERCLRN